MSELQSNAEVTIMASPGKIPVSDISTIDQQTETSNLPILVGVDDMYGEHLSDPEECFVLVDDNKSVDVMSGGDSSVQQLLSDQEPSSSIGVDTQKSVQVMQMDGSKALEMINDRHQEQIKVVQVGDGRTVEVLPMEDGKTVEVVQMDGIDKTLEVMDVDTVKHTEVIPVHVDGSSSITLFSVGGTSLKRPTILRRPSPAMYPKSKNKYIISSKGCEMTTNTLGLKKTLTSESIPSSLPLTLASLTPVNSPFELKLPKNSLSGHHFSPMPTVTTLVTSRQSQVMENDLESITHVTPSIILSGDKRVVPNSLGNLDNTIIISWSAVSPKLDNSVETQTEPYIGDGPCFNLFLCTFHQDGSVETQCDMPVQRDVSVMTSGGGSCRAKIEGNHMSGDGFGGQKIDEKETSSEQPGKFRI